MTGLSPHRERGCMLHSKVQHAMLKSWRHTVQTGEFTQADTLKFSVLSSVRSFYGGISERLQLDTCVALLYDFVVVPNACVFLKKIYKSYQTWGSFCKFCLGIHVKSYAIRRGRGMRRGCCCPKLELCNRNCQTSDRVN